jgi:hypothetical protein
MVIPHFAYVHVLMFHKNDDRRGIIAGLYPFKRAKE